MTKPPLTPPLYQILKVRGGVLSGPGQERGGGVTPTLTLTATTTTPPPWCPPTCPRPRRRAGGRGKYLAENEEKNRPFKQKNVELFFSYFLLPFLKTPFLIPNNFISK